MTAKDLLRSGFQQVMKKQCTQPLTAELWNWLPQEIMEEGSGPNLISILSPDLSAYRAEMCPLL